MLNTALLLLSIAPLVAAALVVAFRNPLRIVLPFYAAVVPFGSGLAVPGIPTPYGSVSSLAGLVLIIGLGYALFAGNLTPLPVPPAVPVWLMFLGLAGVSIFWTINSESTATTFFVIAPLVILYVLVRLSPVDATILRRTEMGLIAGALAVGLVGLALLLFGGPTDRLGRSLLEPNHTAAAMVLPLVLVLYRLAHAGTTRLRLVYLGSAVVIVVALVLTGSRGGLLGVMLAVFVGIAASYRPRRLLTMAVASVCVIVLTFAVTPVDLPSRLFSSDSSGRTDIWRVGAVGCMTYCVQGSGWGTFPDVYEETLPGVEKSTMRAASTRYEAHNNVILTAVELGVLGLPLLLTGLLLVAREAWRVPPAYRAPPAGAIAGLLVTGMLLSNLEFKYYWMALTYIGMVATVHGPQRTVQPADSDVSAGTAPRVAV